MVFYRIIKKVKNTTKKGFTRGHRMTFKMRGFMFIPLNL